MISAPQARMARAAVRLTVREVSEKTGLSKTTIVRFEAGNDTYARTAETLERFYQHLGLKFPSEYEVCLS